MRAKSPILVACLLALAATPGVRADDGTGGYFDDPAFCFHFPADPSVGPMQNRFRCVSETKKEADRELNSVYQQLLKAADEREKTYLKNMQNAWIALRDAQCGLGMYYRRGGTHIQAWGEECEAVMTLRRIRELNQLGTGILWNQKSD